MIQYRNVLLGLSFLLLCCCGCSSSDGNVGWVDGVVTLNGDPVEGATIRFYPVTDRGSSGKTDENGYYELRYTRSLMGAVIGDHKVTVSTEVVADNYGQEGGEEARSEEIPKKYRDPKKTVLEAAVKSGNNEFNFDLTTE